MKNFGSDDDKDGILKEIEYIRIPRLLSLYITTSHYITLLATVHKSLLSTDRGGALSVRESHVTRT
ncbi:unnamed protein product [Sphenostylis stenocarpa]|uniref:Uncharacterized protein n=1 Tax=Sphenostylis stenocarpa TaxID=92480 RepID=A0AA86V2M8_9FABA|nr:unnamed protein product [Sphenostylis stenocarpa]